MKVILKHDVKGLGREGDMKDVKDGYARNFLLPTGAAVIADKGAVANWERHREQREERDRTIRADAEATAEKLNQLRIEIPVKAGERGRLFGAVTSHQIVEAIRREGVEIDRHALHLREPIKTLGDYKVDARIMAGVDATVSVHVVAQE
ncbi:MAG TPA: 50S ribosomal protein L9 [Candidatus Limnocylindria bacterium]|jgi:large subunit ribosomal protein L9|nr:50S ribosomal protein L9 [Candidatus Limnocylindria bacterium]